MTECRCWICGDAGTTGEHKIKRTDLKSELGNPTQDNPLYYNDGMRKNRRVGSLKADILKFSNRICAKCNNEWTQPYDRAWEQMSKWLRTREPPITVDAFVRGNRIFRYDTKREMQNVQLYFVKFFGCSIKEAEIPIDLASFATAILKGKAHPQIYLKFYKISLPGGKTANGQTDIWTDLRPDGVCAFASCFYEVGDLAINVMFAADREARPGLKGAWHPRFGTNRLLICDFR